MRSLFWLVLFVLSCGGWEAAAGGYPERTITLIVPQAPGSTVDIVGRILAQKFGERGVSMVVFNRTGALGQLAAKDCALAPPDGYTLCVMGDGSFALIPAAMAAAQQPPFPPFTPIGFTTEQYFALVVRNELPKDFPSFVGYARAHPGELACGSANIWGTFGIGILNSVSGVTVREIPHKGGEPQALLELKAGRIDCLFATMATTLSFIRAGEVRVLGTLGIKKNPYLPDIAPLAEQGFPEFRVTGSFQALLGPAELPRPVVTFLNRTLSEILADPAVAELLDKTGTSVRQAGTPGQVQETIDGLFAWTKQFVCRQNIELLGYRCVK